MARAGCIGLKSAPKDPSSAFGIDLDVRSNSTVDVQLGGVLLKPKENQKAYLTGHHGVGGRAGEQGRHAQGSHSGLGVLDR